MTDNQIIWYIQQTPELKKLWDMLNKDQRKQVIEEADGDDWHLDEIMEAVMENRHE